MTKLKVGDTVRMSAIGKMNWPETPGNPRGIEGKVTSTTNEFFPFAVRWNNGRSNDYREEDLELVSDEIAVSYTLTDRAASVFFNGKSYVVPSTESHYKDLVEYLRGGKYTQSELEVLVDKPKVIERKAGGHVRVVGSTVYYKDTPVYSVLAARLVELMEKGFDVTRWKLFMENMMENPSYKSRQSLYTFLDKYHTPITDDGHFLAFKRVRGNFKDLHTGTMDNSPGKVVEMPREEVDDDSNRTCSSGLHACASSYLGSFYSSSVDAKVVVVKINPRDVVAVPTDYQFSKMRVCRYEVLGEAEESTVNTIQESVAYDWE